MAIHEIRETLEQQEVILDGNGLGIVQKKITLQSRMRHNIVQLDFFQDSLFGTDSPETYIEFIVSPYPVIYSDMPFKTTAPVLPSRGPSAGNDTVLFKAIIGPTTGTEFSPIRQFPNQQLGANPTFSFYTPTLYITALIHGDGDSIYEDLAFSFYIATDDKKAGLVEYGLGVMRERSVAQGINLMNQGRTIPPSGNVGQVFPMWKYGGVRPERMLRGDALADFFLPYSSEDSEKMLTTTNVREYLSGARTMQPFDTAFGDLDATKGNIPDWLRFGLNRGLVSGPIRPQQPPRKLDDNGNTLMF
jgi:hypothetical protein